MPSRFRVRRIFGGLVRATARPLASAGAKPNTITYFSLLLSFIAALVLNTIESTVIFGIFVFLSGFFDGVDGAVARERGVESNAGAFTDSLVDKISEILILGAIAVRYSGTLFLGMFVEIWVIVAISGWMLTSYTRARATSLNVTDLDIGVGGRSERLFTLVVFSILSLLLWGLLLVCLMGILTAAYRFHHYRREIEDKEN